MIFMRRWSTERFVAFLCLVLILGCDAKSNPEPSFLPPPAQPATPPSNPVSKSRPAPRGPTLIPATPAY